MGEAFFYEMIACSLSLISYFTIKERDAGPMVKQSFGLPLAGILAKREVIVAIGAAAAQW